MMPDVLKIPIEKACRMDADLILTIGGVSVKKDGCGETYGLLGRDLFPRSEDEARIPDDGRKLSENPDA